jgi:uncharacterized protein with von Willebrand factor type A (vWA) domain
MSESKGKTFQEALNEHQETYQKNIRAVADLKDQLIAAQDKAHKSHCDLAALNEQYLAAIIQSHEKKLKDKGVQ